MKKIPARSKRLEKKAPAPRIVNDYSVNQIKNNKLIVVLGMHRSGTSVIAAGLQVMGVVLGDRLLPSVNGDNDKGYYEDIDLNELNIECLDAIDSDWDRLSAITAIDIAVLKKQGYFLRAVNLLRQKVRMNAPIFGFKDPRVAKLLPFWKQVFDYCKFEVNYVLVVRHPLSVVKSLIKRSGMLAEQSYFLWLVHVITSMAVNYSNNSVIVDYDCMMQSPDNELNRIATAFDLKIDQVALDTYKTEFIDQGLRHTTYELDALFLDDECPAIVWEIYGSLLQIASDKIKFDDVQYRSDIARWVNEFERLRCPLELADKLLAQKQIVSVSDAEPDEKILSLNCKLHDKNVHIFNIEAELRRLLQQLTSKNQEISERDSQIASLNNALLEQNQRNTDKLATMVCEFNHIIAGHEGQLASFALEVEEKNNFIEKLEKNKQDHDKQLASFSGQVFDKDVHIFNIEAELRRLVQQLTSQNQVIAEHEEQLASFKLDVEKKNNFIEDLEKIKQDSDTQLASLSGLVDEKDAALHRHEAELKGQKLQLTSQNQQISEFENQITSLNNTLLARDQRNTDKLATMVCELNQVIAEHEEQLASFKLDIEKKNNFIEDLEKIKQDSDTQLASLSGLVDEKDVHIHNIEEHLVQLDRQIEFYILEKNMLNEQICKAITNS